ncbi:chordin-like protein 1 [Glandiceps talaboti]
MKTLVVFLSVILLVSKSEARSKQSHKDNCSFGERIYSSGDSWHPFLQPMGYLTCITCTCREGLVTCMNIRCPVIDCNGAKPVSVAGQCCKKYNENEGHRPGLTDSHNQPCEYKGLTYQHGELFSAEGIFNSRRNDQCVQCSCSDARVFCALRTCPVISCLNPIVLPDSCCPVCPDNGEEWEYDYYDIASDTLEETTTTTPNKQIRREHLFADVLKGEVILSGPISGVTGESSKEDSSESDEVGEDVSEWVAGPSTRKDWQEPRESDSRDCLSNGQIYGHGDSWNPYLFPFGRMNCILCTCKNTKTKCERLTCPADDELPCDSPVKLRGQCCKTCPDDADGAVVEEMEEAEECVMDRQTLLVYEYTPNSAEQMEHTGKLQFAIDNLKAKVIELHKFILEGGEVKDFEIEKLSAEEFVQLREQDRQGRFELAGASTEHRLRKLKRKETQLSENCREDCHRQINKLVGSLKPRQIEKRMNLCENNRDTRERGREGDNNDSNPGRRRRHEQ